MEAVGRDWRHALQGIDRNHRTACTLVAPPLPAHPQFALCQLLLHMLQTDTKVRQALLFEITGGKWTLPGTAPTGGCGGLLDQIQLPTLSRALQFSAQGAAAHATLGS